MRKIKLNPESIMKDLVFEKSFDGNFICFSGHYGRYFFTGSNESGEFKVENHKNFNSLNLIRIQYEISNEYLKIKNKNKI